LVVETIFVAVTGSVPIECKGSRESRLLGRENGFGNTAYFGGVLSIGGDCS
jgi:hypothetical protein